MSVLETLIVGLIVAAAALHVLRRWWPRRRGQGKAATGCGTGCGGCGGCGVEKPRG